MRHCARADYLDFFVFCSFVLSTSVVHRSLIWYLLFSWIGSACLWNPCGSVSNSHAIHARKRERERELITEFTISLSIRELCGWSANISARYYYWFQYRQPYNSNIISVRGVMDIGNTNFYDKNSSTPWIVPKNASPTKFCFDDGMN